MIIKSNKISFRKKFIPVFILLFLMLACAVLLFFNKVTVTNTPFMRLAQDYNGDWGSEALGTFDTSMDINYIPKVAVLDTGCNNNDINDAFCYNIVNKNTDVSDTQGHGTDIYTKLTELNNNFDPYIIKICDEEGKITEDSLSSGIKKSIEENVDIINLSIGTESDYPQIKTCINKAVNKGIIVVAAAGNGDSNPMYPACYDGVISVTARDINNKNVFFNGKNQLKKTVSAPGEHILCSGKYLSGTSIATVYITAAVIRIFNIDGQTNLNNVENILCKSSLYPDDNSYGIINYKNLDENLR